MAIPARPVKLGLIQSHRTADAEANLAATLTSIEEAAAEGAQIICLQELFTSLYFCQSEDADQFALAEPIPGPTTETLAAAAKQHECVVVGSVFERRAAGIYHNTAVVLDADGSLLGIYRKMHIPDDPLYYEKFYFTPGDLGFRVFATRYGRVAPLVCWDQWYPEAARVAALRGADLLVYPTAIGWHPSEKAEHGAAQHDAWRTVQRSHAIANGLFVAAINRVGLEKPLAGAGGAPRDYEGIEFWGSSFVTSPSGEVLAEAPETGDAVIVTEIDFAEIEHTRQGWPFLRDRRIDAYGDLARRFVDD